MMAGLTPEQVDSIKTKIAECSVITKGGCWIHTLGSRGGSHDVFGTLNIPGSGGQKIKAHRFQAMMATGRPPFVGDEASHLCGNPRCVRQQHMWWESGPINQSRKCCHMFLGWHADYICPHTPACICLAIDLK